MRLGAGSAAVLRLRCRYLLHGLVGGLLLRLCLRLLHAALLPYGHLGDERTATTCAAVQRCRRIAVERRCLPVGLRHIHADGRRRGIAAIVVSTMIVAMAVIVTVAVAVLDAAHALLLHRVVLVVAAHWAHAVRLLMTSGNGGRRRGQRQRWLLARIGVHADVLGAGAALRMVMLMAATAKAQKAKFAYNTNGEMIQMSVCVCVCDIY